MLPKPLKWLWGDLSGEEVKKFSILSGTLLFVIGSYWLLRPLKDGIFVSIVGIEYQPMAKIVSLLVLIPVILFYSKLVDMFEKHKLFYVIGFAYVVGFMFVAYFLSHPTIGLANTVASPSRIFGWFTYVLIESFGSLMVALFWSFVASSTTPASAKRGFPLIIAGAQIGSITGPTLATYATVIGIPTLAVIAAIGIGMVMVMVTVFMRVIPRELSGAEDKTAIKKPKTGMIEGIRLILTRPYVLGIFGVATLYEIIGTIIDYQMKVLARQTYTTPEAFTEFMGRFGQSVNGLALVFALLGTGFLIRRFGLRFCLLLFPIAVGFVVAFVYVYPVLWGVFISMVAIKGLSYALNNPVKESMYLPTSKDVKFKAKGWIDMFGNRSAKGTGSLINNALKGVPGFMAIGTVISLGVVGVWIMVALYVGKTFEKLTTENKIVD